MTHCVPCSALPRLLHAVLWFGLLAGLTAPDAPAAPPAPVAPIITSAATRFTDNSNGTVTDSLTGLIWLKNTNCTDTVGGITKSSGTLNWTNALTWTASLASGSCNLTDGSTAGQWRLPNRNELQSLIDYTRKDPALPDGHPFMGVQFNYYWSSTTYPPAAGISAWAVEFHDGIVNGDAKGTGFYVWPVRGGQ